MIVVTAGAASAPIATAGATILFSGTTITASAAATASTLTTVSIVAGATALASVSIGYAIDDLESNFIENNAQKINSISSDLLDTDNFIFSIALSSNQTIKGEHSKNKRKSTHDKHTRANSRRAREQNRPPKKPKRKIPRKNKFKVLFFDIELNDFLNDNY